MGFNHTEHVNDSGACYDDPNDPLLPAPDGGAQCLLGNAYIVDLEELPLAYMPGNCRRVRVRVAGELA